MLEPAPSSQCAGLQDLDIPDELKALYKTVWEIKQRVLVDMAADRGAFIDQSQSFNVHMSDPNFGKLTSLHFYAWKVRPLCTMDAVRCTALHCGFVVSIRVGCLLASSLCCQRLRLDLLLISSVSDSQRQYSYAGVRHQTCLNEHPTEPAQHVSRKA